MKGEVVVVFVFEFQMMYLTIQIACVLKKRSYFLIAAFAKYKVYKIGNL